MNLCVFCQCMGSRVILRGDLTVDKCLQKLDSKRSGGDGGVPGPPLL